MVRPLTPKRSGLPLPSTTLMLLRPGNGELQVLMLRRVTRASFGGAWVFPGGVLDRRDRDQGLYGRCLGALDAHASRALSVSDNGLAYWVAAVRETFEEAGLLMAVNACGQSIRGTATQRRALIEGRVAFAELCRRGNWRLPTRRIHYVGHWITPSAAPRRFSTRFLAAAAPGCARVRPDGREVLNARWFNPAEALREEIPLAHPTRHFLRTLAGLGSLEKALNWARNMDRRPIPAVRPEVRRIDGRLMSCLPGGEVLGPYVRSNYPVASEPRPN